MWRECVYKCAALQWKLLHVTGLLSQHYLCESKISQKAFIAQLCYGYYLRHFAQVSCSWHFFGVGIILSVLKALDNSYWVHFVRKSRIKVVYIGTFDTFTLTLKLISTPWIHTYSSMWKNCLLIKPASVFGQDIQCLWKFILEMKFKIIHHSKFQAQPIHVVTFYPDKP